jgi:hypothetical protein
VGKVNLTFYGGVGKIQEFEVTQGKANPKIYHSYIDSIHQSGQVTQKLNSPIKPNTPCICDVACAKLLRILLQRCYQIKIKLQGCLKIVAT